MKVPVRLIQTAIAFGIYDVWLVRSRKATPWRGGHARNLREEFAEYGLPGWFMWTVGTLKLGSATSLLLGLKYPAATRPAAVSLAALMAGAVSMHLKVKDPVQRSLPALAMLALSLYVAKYGGRQGAAEREQGPRTLASSIS